MKKKLAIVLTVMMIISLVFTSGCGKKETTPAPAEETEKEETEKEETEAEGDDEAEEPKETESSEAEEAETIVPEDILGELTATSYINKCFALQYDVPEGWYILTKAEMLELLGEVAASIDDETIAKLYENDGYVTDLYAMETTPAIEGLDAYNNVNVTIQDIGKLYGMIYDEKTLADASLSSVKQALESQGLTVVNAEVGESEFLGKSCVHMVIHSKAGDIDMYQKQMYLKSGSAMACVTATSIGADKTEEILAAFK